MFDHQGAEITINWSISSSILKEGRAVFVQKEVLYFNFYQSYLFISDSNVLRPICILQTCIICIVDISAFALSFSLFPTCPHMSHVSTSLICHLIYTALCLAHCVVKSVFKPHQLKRFLLRNLCLLCVTLCNETRLLPLRYLSEP